MHAKADKSMLHDFEIFTVKSAKYLGNMLTDSSCFETFK